MHFRVFFSNLVFVRSIAVLTRAKELMIRFDGNMKIIASRKFNHKMFANCEMQHLYSVHICSAVASYPAKHYCWLTQSMQKVTRQYVNIDDYIVGNLNEEHNTNEALWHCMPKLLSFSVSATNSSWTLCARVSSLFIQWITMHKHIDWLWIFYLQIRGSALNLETVS